VLVGSNIRRGADRGGRVGHDDLNTRDAAGVGAGVDERPSRKRPEVEVVGVSEERAPLALARRAV